MGIELRITGVRELQAVLAAAAVRADDVTREAVIAGTAILDRETKEQLRRSSHPKGTLTPSAPGEPPSLISGNLMRSIAIRGPAGGAGTWAGSVGPTAIYGRIQELGGTTGRGHRTQLPARPYQAPAVDAAMPEIRATFLTAWSTIFERG